jgi:hypothetical protein
MENLSTAALFEHVLRIEQELTQMRQVLLKRHSTELAHAHPGSLRGIWQTVVLEEEDFTIARASLFPERDF